MEPEQSARTPYEPSDAVHLLQRMLDDSVSLLSIVGGVPLSLDRDRPTAQADLHDRLVRLWPNVRQAYSRGDPEVSDFEFVSETLVRIIDDLVVQVARAAVCLNLEVSDLYSREDPFAPYRRASE